MEEALGLVSAMVVAVHLGSTWELGITLDGPTLNAEALRVGPGELWALDRPTAVHCCSAELLALEEKEILILALGPPWIELMFDRFLLKLGRKNAKPQIPVPYPQRQYTKSHMS